LGVSAADTCRVVCAMDKGLSLCGARVALDAREAVCRNLTLRRGRVYFDSAGTGQTLDLSGFLVLPGLINAHDHLELNLFPRLGNGPYANARIWAEDIYHPDQAPAKQNLSVPKAVRLAWGGIKNLLSGVTTVVHHNPYIESSFDSLFPVRVPREYGFAHSLRFSPDWKERYEQTPPNWPFIIHAAEGRDDESRAELRALDIAGALAPNTVLVHGVALNAADARVLFERKASLIWCPSSNLFTLGRTVSKDVLESEVEIALGTDSALTADGDLLDELRMAHSFVSSERLYDMVTSIPATILRLESGAGKIQHGGPADLVIARDTGSTPANALLQLHPEAVFVAGELRLLSIGMARHLSLAGVELFESIEIEGRGKWLLPFPVSSLVAQAKQELKAGLRLAGKAVAA
jgi:cytosine/adenosine deaminase-related metal-dependent hydrolase